MVTYCVEVLPQGDPKRFQGDPKRFQGDPKRFQGGTILNVIVQTVP